MKSRTIIGNILFVSSMFLGSAQAVGMHPDEAFKLINNDDSNYIQSGENNGIQTVSIHPDEHFKLINSGDSSSIMSGSTVEFSKMELNEIDSGNELRRNQSITDFIHYLTSY